MASATELERIVATLRDHPSTRDASIDNDGTRLWITRGEARALVAPGAFVEAMGETEVLALLSRNDTALIVIGHPAARRLASVLREGTCSVVHDADEPDAVALVVASTLEHVDLKHRARTREKDLARAQYELSELVQIARAITQERNLARLLGLILEKSRYITGADAGSIYVVEGPVEFGATQKLRFKLSQNDSVAFASAEFTMPVSRRSIAGAAVLAREPIVIEDVYHMPPDAPYAFDPSFDQRVGYTTRSMIAVPMISAADEVIGVIQLINKKLNPRTKLASAEIARSEVVPFDARSQELLATLASQAGIALENAMLYEEIRAIFEGFVRASVQAIEQRDPTTSGHSQRVSLLACRLAEMVDRTSAGLYRDAHFNARDLKELEYASLLHDFGKIGVREQVLVKAKKLYPHQLDAIEQRVEYAVLRAELELVREQYERQSRGETLEPPEALERRIAERKATLWQLLTAIREANEPTVLQEGDFSRLREIAELRYRAEDGQPRALISLDELAALQVRRGSLSNPEMDEIRSHVVHTRNFLARIPWGQTYARIPEIAGAHHERLNGSGYPLKLKDPEIPLASKIMSVADIYDALTARDRPYKRAIAHERAVEILEYEVRDGHVCAELVRIFRESDTHHVLEQATSDSVRPHKHV